MYLLVPTDYTMSPPRPRGEGGSVFLKAYFHVREDAIRAACQCHSDILPPLALPRVRCCAQAPEGLRGHGGSAGAFPTAAMLPRTAVTLLLPLCEVWG